MTDWQALRRQFPVTEHHIYMNHAAVAPLPQACVDGMQAYLQELAAHGAARYPAPIANVLTDVRSLGARLLGTSPSHVFVVRSTTQGLGLCVTGLPWTPGDNVVLADKEFPANVRPWMPLARRGVQVRRVPQRDGRIDLQDLRQRVDGRTRVVSLSFVQFLSGFRLDLEGVASLCRQHDALFVVDGIQGVGAFPIEVERQGVDFLSADGHKWMLGPEGVGIGYASPRALERMVPAVEGWLSVERPFDFFDLDQPLKTTAARFEEGAHNVAGLYGFVESLRLLETYGTDAVAQRILELTDVLADGLRARGWDVLSPRDCVGEKSGIVLCARDGVAPDRLERRLAEADVVASIRGGALRLSPHAYNTPDEIAQVLDVLAGA
jgi:cysteine desulfurase/selenocysteine lyase